MSIRVVTDKELQGHIESILASSILHKGTHGWMKELEGALAQVRMREIADLFDAQYTGRIAAPY
ncbi:hypothetical protein [Pseudomonas sichuanensis]|uniref:hypothetical protein n=1 Tax=Pseudomonas sichuanensis TaxID=2213015 RepID=UPI00130026A9|nr:hypothetical protein [Pseudomonas sichuanensis]